MGSLVPGFVGLGFMVLGFRVLRLFGLRAVELSGCTPRTSANRRLEQEDNPTPSPLSAAKFAWGGGSLNLETPKP